MKKLHIIFLDFDDIKNPLLGAGQANATLEIGKRLAQKGHTVDVICSRYPGYKDRIEEGIRYQHIGVGTKYIRFNNLLYILLLPFTVMKLKGDVVVECFTAPISTLLSPLFTKIPVVGLPTSFDAERFSKLYHIPFWIIEKYGAKFYKFFIALTPYLDKKMRSLNPNIISVIIGQGVSSRYFAIANKKPKHILSLGRLDVNQKGIDLMIDSYSKVSNKIPYPLVIAGDGPDKKRIQDRILKLKLEKKVKMVGFANERKKYNLLSESAFVAFPSRNEGFSLFSLEAIASGHRLVAFDIPSLYFTNPKVANKVKPFDTNAYANALLKEVRLTEHSSYEEICRNFAKKYSWDEVTNQFENFFQKITLHKIN